MCFHEECENNARFARKNKGVIQMHEEKNHIVATNDNKLSFAIHRFY